MPVIRQNGCGGKLCGWSWETIYRWMFVKSPLHKAFIHTWYEGAYVGIFGALLHKFQNHAYNTKRGIYYRYYIVCLPRLEKESNYNGHCILCSSVCWIGEKTPRTYFFPCSAMIFSCIRGDESNFNVVRIWIIEKRSHIQNPLIPAMHVKCRSKNPIPARCREGWLVFWRSYGTWFLHVERDELVGGTSIQRYRRK